jgi:hypothetical protein
MRVFLSSRAVHLLVGVVLPLVLLSMFHRLSVLLPWHAALIGCLLAVTAFLWSHAVNVPWLRAAALPGLAFGALFVGIVALFSAPLAALALIGFGQRLTMRGDFIGSLSLLMLAFVGFAPLLTLHAYITRLLEVRGSVGLGSSLTLGFSAVLVAVGVWFASSVTSSSLETAMLEREWQPGGTWQRLFQFDAVCESGCRNAFVRLYASTREEGRASDRLERNFTLLYGQELPQVWEAERLEPWKWRESASR